MSIYRFGDFELNEESRGLRLAGAEIATQPLVFDFLAHLLRHQERAVSKQELLDTLWPDVTVTEASLQRVASLARAVLRQGGMEPALRSLSRFGYRLCIEPAPAEPRTVVAPDADGLLSAAREAVRSKRWADAVSAFESANRRGLLAPADLEQWALAIECTGRVGDAIDPLKRALSGYCAEGSPLRAVNPALTLSKIHLERGEMAVAKGWHRRAADLLGDNAHSREYGLWCWMGGRIAAAEADPERALGLADRAYDIGRALNDPVVESLGLIYRGFFKLCLGETDAGRDDQDLAAALGLSSDIDPIVGGILYCNILWACRNFGDWARANQWTLSYQRWSLDSGLDFSGSCRLHRAEVLGLHGTLKEAEALVRASLDQLASDAPWATGDALRVLGDIHLAAGDLDEAEKAYRDAHAIGWDPQPGFAMLQLERGEEEAAYLGLERSLIGRGWPTLQRRGLLLATLAKVAARTGRKDRAMEIVTELETQPRRWPMPSIRALTAEAKAELFLREGRQAEAARELQSALASWNEVDSAINAAGARLALAGVLAEAGDLAGAELELRAARQVAAKVDSRRLLDRSDQLDAAIAAARSQMA